VDPFLLIPSSYLPGGDSGQLDSKLNADPEETSFNCQIEFGEHYLDPSSVKYATPNFFFSLINIFLECDYHKKKNINNVQSCSQINLEQLLQRNSQFHLFI
jgi:hypothetical protein